MQCQVRDNPGRRAGEIIGHKAQVRRRCELKSVAEAIMIAATIANQLELDVRQGEERQQVDRRNFAWEAVEALTLGIGEQTNTP